MPGSSAKPVEAHHKGAVHTTAVQQRVLRHHIIHQIGFAQDRILLGLFQRKTICGTACGKSWMSSRKAETAWHFLTSAYLSASTAGNRTAAIPPRAA